MKSKPDKGFTLVEVMVALAVVAIVSTSLFQMFVTTSYVNKDAQIVDSANVITVQLAETFKADPEAVYSSGNRYSYYYYKGDGTFIPPVYYDLTVPEGAAIKIISDLPDPTVTTNEAGYYPDFVGTIDLSEYTADNLDVNITNTNEIGVEPAGSAFESLPLQESSNIKNNIIPIRVDFQGNPRTINVSNNSDLEAEFYIFDTNHDSDVIFNTLQGNSSIAYVPDSSTSSNKAYDLRLTVYKLSKGIWVEMFTYSANKYIHY